MAAPQEEKPKVKKHFSVVNHIDQSTMTAVFAQFISFSLSSLQVPFNLARFVVVVVHFILIKTTLCG